MKEQKIHFKNLIKINQPNTMANRKKAYLEIEENRGKPFF